MSEVAIFGVPAFNGTKNGCKYWSAKRFPFSAQISECAPDSDIFIWWLRWESSSEHDHLRCGDTESLESAIAALERAARELVAASDWFRTEPVRGVSERDERDEEVARLEKELADSRAHNGLLTTDIEGWKKLAGILRADRDKLTAHTWTMGQQIGDFERQLAEQTQVLSELLTNGENSALTFDECFLQVEELQNEVNTLKARVSDLEANGTSSELDELRYRKLVAIRERDNAWDDLARIRKALGFERMVCAAEMVQKIERINARKPILDELTKELKPICGAYDNLVPALQSEREKRDAEHARVCVERDQAQMQIASLESLRDGLVKEVEGLRAQANDAAKERERLERRNAQLANASRALDVALTEWERVFRSSRHDEHEGPERRNRLTSDARRAMHRAMNGEDPSIDRERREAQEQATSFADAALWMIGKLASLAETLEGQRRKILEPSVVQVGAKMPPNALADSPNKNPPASAQSSAAVTERMAYRSEPSSPVESRLAPGTQVRTAANIERRDYTYEAHALRRPGVLGLVIGASDSHGLCYKVMHLSDKSEAWYDPDQIAPI